MKFRRPLVILGLAGVVAALVIGGTAFAQTPTLNQQTGTNYQSLFMDKLAAALGVTRDKLNSAFTQARNDTVDQQVKDGKLTQQRADEIKARQSTEPFGFGFRGAGPGPKDGGPGPRGGGVFVGGADVQNAIAQALGITAEDLATQLKSGKTLADLAKGKEQAVKDAVVSATKTRLDQAVKDGKMTQEQANQALDRIRNSDLSKLGGPWSQGAPRDRAARPAAPTARPAQ